MELEPAMELKSRIVYIKDVEAGTEISYGGTYTAGEKRRIATIAAGYGDGYPAKGNGISGFRLYVSDKFTEQGKLMPRRSFIRLIRFRKMGKNPF